MRDDTNLSGANDNHTFGLLYRALEYFRTDWHTKYLLHSLILYIIYRFMVWVWVSFKLPEDSYHNGIYLPDVLGTSRGIVVLGIIGLILLLNYTPYYRFIHWKQDYFKQTYRSISWGAVGGTKFRWLVICGAAIMLWVSVLYDYNYYYAHWHLLERLACLFAFLWLIINPLGIIPFVALVMLIFGQFTYPSVVFFSLTDKLLVLHFLYLVTAYIIGKFCFRISLQSFIFILLCLVGAQYFVPILAKMSLGDSPLYWVLEDRLDYRWMATYTSGWLRFLSYDEALVIADIFARFGILGKIVTLVVELGAIAILVNRRITLVLLLGFVGLHVGIFLSSGVFFWKWIILDIALIVFFILSRDDESITAVYRLPYFIVSLILIGFGNIFFGALPLGWIDSGISKNFDVIVIDDQGNRYEVHRLFFAPYDVVFAQNRFDFLRDDLTMVSVNGNIRDVEAYQAVNRAEVSAEGLEDVYQQYGMNRYSKDSTEAFTQFLSVWFQQHNRNRNINQPINWLTPLRHIITFPPENNYDGEFAVREVIVEFNRYIYRDGLVVPIEVGTELVRIPIPE